MPSKRLSNFLHPNLLSLPSLLAYLVSAPQPLLPRAAHNPSVRRSRVQRCRSPTQRLTLRQVASRGPQLPSPAVAIIPAVRAPARTPSQRPGTPTDFHHGPLRGATERRHFRSRRLPPSLFRACPGRDWNGDSPSCPQPHPKARRPGEQKLIGSTSFPPAGKSVPRGTRPWSPGPTTNSSLSTLFHKNTPHAGRFYFIFIKPELAELQGAAAAQEGVG